MSGFSATTHRPRHDVYSDNEKYYVDVELPGVKKHNVHVHVDGDMVHVRAEYTKEETKFLFIRRERPVGEVEQRFWLGKKLDADKMEARFEDGLLHLAIPVKAESAGRTVAVQ